MTQEEERAILGTYSSLGYYAKGTLVTLGLNRSIGYNKFDPLTQAFERGTKEELEIRDQAISYYQSASTFWKQGLYGENTSTSGQSGLTVSGPETTKN